LEGHWARVGSLHPGTFSDYIFVYNPRPLSLLLEERNVSNPLFSAVPATIIRQRNQASSVSHAHPSHNRIALLPQADPQRISSLYRHTILPSRGMIPRPLSANLPPCASGRFLRRILPLVARCRKRASMLMAFRVQSNKGRISWSRLVSLTMLGGCGREELGIMRGS